MRQYWFLIEVYKKYCGLFSKQVWETICREQGKITKI